MMKLVRAVRVVSSSAPSRRGLSAAAAAAKKSAPAAAAAAADEKAEEKATFKVRNPYKLHKLDQGPSDTVEVTKSDLLRYFETLSYYRRVELVSFNLYQQRKIRGFCHLYDGQEAITVGMEDALTYKDSIITAYRDHTIAMSRGNSGFQVLAEMMGKAEGSSKGKGGSMHYYNPANNFYGGNGIVGAQVPVGAGVAYAHKFRGNDGACFALYGDGAANQGQIFEAANMAALWKLPLVFCCENNLYAMGTSIARGSASREYYKRGDYVPGVWVDGMDVLAVRQAVAWAKAYCVAGNGPLFMEFSTYRYRGHSMSDPGISYRARDEIEGVRRDSDCIELVKKRILELGWATADDLKAVTKKIEKVVDAELERAEAAKVPDPAEMATEVYAEPPKFHRMVEFENSIRR